ncbi:DUF6011 domain-containing protein [Streptomyces megasporus]|uniref:DUF6011 domain-containing protein n=1 Tax=Streptomyces megasporus TaxID=44060 RepID=UPI0009963501|nr:DUF6011 domain-containing protein [Streptomyces megasporus]
MAEPSPLPDSPEPPARERPPVRCRLCGRPLRDRQARLWGLGPECRGKLAVRSAPRTTGWEVAQEALPGLESPPPAPGAPARPPGRA